MAQSIEVEQDDDLYWNLGSAFAQVLSMEINDALKDTGIDDAKTRRKICSQIGFGLGNFLDQYWMEIGGQKYYPLLCFSKKFLDIGVEPQEIAPVQLPSKDFEFHGAADDVTVDFFKKQNEQLEDVRIGPIGSD